MAEHEVLQLDKGYSVKLDKDDFCNVRKYRWHAHVNAKPNSRQVYAYATIDGKRGIKLHRFLLGVQDPKTFVDHINGDTLDCRRCNLRTCDASGNARNQGKYRGSSIYKGVHWHKQRNKWRVTFPVNGKVTHVGLFSSEVEAAKAYDSMAREHFGEFARTNFQEVSHLQR